MSALPETKRTAPEAPGAVQDQTTAKSPDRLQSIAVPKSDTVFAVAWRRPPRGSDRWPRRVTAYRPTIEQARRVAAGAAEVAVDGPPVIFATPAVWEVTA